MEDGLRQGNENEEVDIFTYVTEQTFDAYLFQLVENKQKYISQIMTSKAIVRSADDIDEKALSYAEIKALAAGNPLIIEKTNLDAEVSKLRILKNSFLNQKYALEDAIIKYYPKEIKAYEQIIKNIEEDIKVIEENTNINNEEKFSTMKLEEKYYTNKESAGKKLLEICVNKFDKEKELIGEYRGIKMYLEITRGDFVLTLKNTHFKFINLGNDIYGNITRIDNAIDGFKKEIEEYKNKLADVKVQFEHAKIDVKIPFNKEEELKQKIKKLEDINKELGLEENENEIIDEIEEQEKCNDKEEQNLKEREDERW